LLATFVKSYLSTTFKGKRSVLVHMNKIGFDLNKLVDLSFRTLSSYYVPLAVALDILMAYLVEGVKILFRYTYGVMKCHKKFIKQCTNASELLDALKTEARANTLPSKIHDLAFSYPLKRSNYDFKKANIEKFIDPNNPSSLGGDFCDYVPNLPSKSSIVSFDEFSKIWVMLPEWVRIRIPEMVYCAHNDGFNLQSMWRKMQPFKNDYKFSLLLIQTKKDQVFGAYVDDVFRKYLKGYLGSNETFVFTLKPEIHIWHDAEVNQRYLLGEQTYFQIGGEGDGPAIWVNETLDRGQTNHCATFNNDMLTLGQKDKDEQFEIHNIELFLL
jgi:hypothetical protein